ncbi:hypothetical protein [Haloarcula amylovorans]|uniref:hypothetical protein n=1 Tax=Haloarcula amylovorans TaxID=2562280 RepID=UPI00142F5DB5|nr:hypothetical protein [Halomicroarcula amylolytica]
MERFVQFVVAGGLSLAAGLWIATLTASQTPGWFVGVVLVVAGIAGLATGIGRELQVGE